MKRTYAILCFLSLLILLVTIMGCAKEGDKIAQEQVQQPQPSTGAAITPPNIEEKIQPVDPAQYQGQGNLIASIMNQMAQRTENTSAQSE